jgi:hypothetical protein
MRISSSPRPFHRRPRGLNLRVREVSHDPMVELGEGRREAMELLFRRCAPVTRSLAQQALQNSSEPDDLVQNALDIFSCGSIDFDSRKGTRRPRVLKIEQPTGAWGRHLVYNPRSNCEMLRSKHRARTYRVQSPGSLFACSRSCKRLLLKPEYTDICMRDKPRDSRSARRRSPNRTPTSVDFALAIHPNHGRKLQYERTDISVRPRFRAYGWTRNLYCADSFRCRAGD